MKSTGLSLLLLFVALDQAFGWPAGRGADTVTIAHITFATAYMAVGAITKAAASTVEAQSGKTRASHAAAPPKVGRGVRLTTCGSYPVHEIGLSHGSSSGST